MSISKEERARIARENGAKSKGPKTETGKEQSKRNAIKHGERAELLKIIIPPHSSVLMHEERREFYKLFDLNVAKYTPADEPELAVVREITDLEWSNFRNRTSLNTIMNRELLRTAPTLTPIVPENFEVENTVAAYEALAGSAAVRTLNRDYATNTRIIMALERRLAHMQRAWPSKSPSMPDTSEEREQFHTPVEKENEGTQPAETMSEENKGDTPKKRVKEINVKAPLTPQKIALYKRLYPKRDLVFNVFEDTTAENQEAA